MASPDLLGGQLIDGNSILDVGAVGFSWMGARQESGDAAGVITPAVAMRSGPVQASVPLAH